LGRIFYGKSESKCNVAYGNKSYYIKSFTEAVAASASSLLNICAFVTVFSLISDISAIYLPKKAADLLNIIFEFSRGVFKCSAFSNSLTSGFLCGFCIGFGGLSAIFQIISVCCDYPFNKFKFLIYKIAHGLILGVFSLLLVHLMDLEPLKASLSVTYATYESRYIISIAVCAIILFGIFSYNCNRHLKRR